MNLNIVQDLTREELHARLAPLRFPVQKRPLFYADGAESSRSGVWRPDIKKEIATIGKDTPLLSHERNIVPVVQRMVQEGWTLPVDKPTRRSPVRVEGYGRYLHVEMVHPKVHNIGTLQHPEPILARFTASTGYGGEHLQKGDGGGYVVVCTNGLVRPVTMVLVISRKHMGFDEDNSDAMLSMAFKLVSEFGQMVGEWSTLRDITPGKELAEAILKEVTIRDYDKLEGHVRHVPGRASAWDLYQGITHYLTHKARGSQTQADKTSRLALEALLGKRTPVIEQLDWKEIE